MKENKINIGDVVKPSLSINWENEPEDLILEDILNLGNGWVVGVVNATYSQSDGKKSNHVLLEHLELDKRKSRDLLIDQVLSPEESSESFGHSQSSSNM